MSSCAFNDLLKRLCCHINGQSSPENVSQFYEIAVALLTANQFTNIPGNSSTACDNVRRWLAHEKRLQDAARFSFLFNKLQCSNFLKYKAEILHLLYNLKNQGSVKSKQILNNDSTKVPKQKSTPQRPTTLSCNVGGLFGIPALHYQKSSSSTRNEKSKDQFTRASSSNSVEGSGRVARLAAMYNTDDDYKSKTREEGQVIITPKASITPFRSPLHPHTNTNNKLDWKTQRSHCADVSNEALLREILFAFQGIEGNFIKMDTAKDMFKVHCNVRLSKGEREMVHKLVELGWLYNKVNRFCDACDRSASACRQDNSGKLTPSTPMGTEGLHDSVGLVNKSLVLAIREELNEFCRLVAVLEAQLGDSVGSDEGAGGSTGLTLRRLLLWTLEPRDRLRILACVVDSVKGLSGGATLSVLYRHLQHGDEEHVKLVMNLMRQSCKPLFIMLTEWLLDGNLQDPHQDFFIVDDPTVPNERLWHHKYNIRWSSLPSFISHDLAIKILVTGKSLNFLRRVCNFRTPVNGREKIKSSLQKITVDSFVNARVSSNVSDLVKLTFHFASEHVLNEIMDKHKLLMHLGAIRRYLLLGQGDFIHSLMGLLWHELNKPASRLRDHNLTFLLESAICSSNSQYEESDILKRLDLMMLQPSPNETGWDVFSLDYHVDGPIGTVFTSDCMKQYLMMFNSLWKAKRMETILTATWKQQSATSKLCRTLPELKVILHRIQLLMTEMNHLLCQMAYYISFEVLECSWHDLLNQLSRAQSLDDVIEAHTRFLKKIVKGALLDFASQDVQHQLRGLYSLMMRLESLQQKLYQAVVTEIEERTAFANIIEERTRKGEFGVTAEMEQVEQKRKTEFTHNFIPNFLNHLNVLSQTYQDMIQNFLITLSEHENENLQLLSGRLDFNENYLRKNHRLNERLTYLHKRKSMPQER